MRVQQREHIIGGSELSIRALESLTEDLRNQECAVRVSGITASLTHDYIECYFENERHSGGGEIEDKFYSTDVAVITFNSPQGKPVQFLRLSGPVHEQALPVVSVSYTHLTLPTIYSV